MFFFLWLMVLPSRAHLLDGSSISNNPSTVAFNRIEVLGNIITTCSAFLGALARGTSSPHTCQIPHHYVDSCCNRTLTGPSPFVENIQPLTNSLRMQGLNGHRVFSQKCNIRIPVVDSQNQRFEILIQDSLYDPKQPQTLIATRDLLHLGWKFINSWKSSLQPLDTHRHLPEIPLCTRDLPRLPICYDTPQEPTAFVANCGNMSLEELLHLRLGHLPIRRLARSSLQVTGVPRPLKDTQTLRFPCTPCHEAKAKRQPFPDASQSYHNRDTKMICWDMLDMGDQALTWGKNRYLSLFLVVDYHLIIGMLHADKCSDTCISMLKQVFTKANFRPRVIRCDQAGEYLSHDTKRFLTETAACNIENSEPGDVFSILTQNSNAHEQFQNGKSEKLVDIVCQGVRTLLLQSGLPIQAWGTAALYYIDILNSVSSDAIDGDIPFNLHTGQKADWSWFRPFGCRATVWLGKDAVDHHKLSPRGETGIFVGLGLSHGRKSWLVYSPKSKRVFSTRNVTFDETLFPLRSYDQRVFGYYDNQKVEALRAYEYPSSSYDNLHDVLNLPMPNPNLDNAYCEYLTQSIEAEQRQLHMSNEPLHDDDAALDQEESLEELPVPTSITPEGTGLCGPPDTQVSGGNHEALDSSFSGGGSIQPSSSAGGGLGSSSNPASGGSLPANGGGINLTVDHVGRSLPTSTTTAYSDHQSANLGVPISTVEKDTLHAAAPRTNKKRSISVSKSYNRSTSRKILHWWDVQFDPIDECSDDELANFCIGHSINVHIPSDFYPDENGSYCGEVLDTLKIKSLYGNKLCIAILLTAGPQAIVNSKGEPLQLHFPISKHISPNGTDISLRRVLKEQFPQATVCHELTTQPHGQRKDLQAPSKIIRNQAQRSIKHRHNSTLKAFNASPSAESSQTPKIANTIGFKAKSLFPGFCCLVASLMLDQSQNDLDFRSQFLPPEPKNQRDARTRPDSALWTEAEHIELKTIWDMGTFELCDPPKDVLCLPSMFTYKLKIKPDFLTGTETWRRKARLVLRGDLQAPDEFENTFAPTSKFTAVRTIISVATQEQLKLKSFDIQGAFMCSDIDNEHIYVSLPPGYHVPDGKVLRLKKSLYGLRQAPGLFHDTLEKWLVEYGFRAIDPEGTIFRLDSRSGDYLLLSMYVDDGLCATSSNKLYNQFISDMAAKFKLSDQGDLDYYLGVGVKQDLTNGTTTLNQEHYIQTLADRFQMVGCNPVHTPLPPHSRLTKEDCPAEPDKEATRKYQQLVGALLYCSNFCRPDVVYAVNQCTKFMSNPGKTHMNAAKHILAYLYHTKRSGLTYRRSTDPAKMNVLHGFADADHAGDPDGRRSVTGYCLILNGAAISWSSVRQNVVALSSAEAEYYAASSCGTDVQYCRRILEDLGFPQSSPTKVAEDNAACIYMSTSSCMHNKVKHIDTRVYHLRSLCKEGIMSLYKISSSCQTADSLTKSTPLPLFRAHRTVMLGSPVDSML